LEVRVDEEHVKSSDGLLFARNAQKIQVIKSGNAE